MFYVFLTLFFVAYLIYLGVVWGRIDEVSDYVRGILNQTHHAAQVDIFRDTDWQWRYEQLDIGGHKKAYFTTAFLPWKKIENIWDNYDFVDPDVIWED